MFDQLDDLLAQLVEEAEQESELIVTPTTKLFTNCCTYSLTDYGG